jgi:hypothetical protein
VTDLGNAAQIRLRDEERKAHHVKCRIIQDGLDKAADGLESVADDLEKGLSPKKPDFEDDVDLESEADVHRRTRRKAKAKSVI